MLVYKLNADNNLMCDRVCKDISLYLQKYKKNNPNNSEIVMVIQVREISHTTDSLIPKLEYKKE